MEAFSFSPPGSGVEAYTLFSGSSGNSVFIRCGGDSILIDAGMSARSVGASLKSLGWSLDRVSAVFITHEHIDHIRGAAVISKKYKIPFHAAAATADYIDCEPELLVCHSPKYSFTVGDIEVSSFVTPHDSVCSVGYTVDAGEIRIGVATDLGYMPDEVLARLCGCTAVVLESNHDIDMLKNGPYPRRLKERILSPRGHLSNADCADAVCALSRDGVENILLAHLSRENNLPRLAYEASADAMERRGLHRTTLAIASPACPTRLI